MERIETREFKLPTTLEKHPAPETPSEGKRNISEKEFIDAFNKLKEELYGYVYKMTKEEEVTKDILAETFLKVWDKRHQYNQNYEFEWWVYKIAKNNTIDHFRKLKKTRMNVSIDEGVDSIQEDGINYSNRTNLIRETDNSQEKINSEIVSFIEYIVEEYLSKLVFPFDKLYKLRFIEDFKVEKISKILDVPEGTIKVRLMEIREFIEYMLKTQFSDTINIPITEDEDKKRNTIKNQLKAKGIEIDQIRAIDWIK